LGFAVVAAASFGLSGSLAKGMLEAGWSPGAAVTVRIGLAAVVLAIPAMISLRGRRHPLRGNWRLIIVYGLVAVAGCQLAYFNAVAHMDVAMALLIEYAAPVAVVAWLWLRYAQRPSLGTVLGALIAGLGLLMMLGITFGGATAGVSLVGVLWAFGAMLGCATFFVLSADESNPNPLPPLVLAALGLGIGAVSLILIGLFGWLDMSASTQDVTYAVGTVPWFVPVVLLGALSGAVPYTTGIAAARRLGSRMASFVALMEVVFALGVAWVLLDELPAPVQFAGGAIALIGVLIVKRGEGTVDESRSAPVLTEPLNNVA
jgi:drug/metabolite transporter (DMT)-like permease